MAEFASKGVAGAGLGLGIAGTALGLMSGGLGNVLGGLGTRQVTPVATVSTPTADGTAIMAGVLSGMVSSGWNHNGWNHGGCCSEDHLVNRYEAGKDSRIAELETQVKLLEANTYTDQKILATYQYIDTQLKDVRAELCAQAVHNQRTEDSFALASRDLAAVKADLQGQIALEAERRCCADNSIVNYVNATFYPVNVVDVTIADTSTAQTRYNPIPRCGCCCGGNG